MQPKKQKAIQVGNELSLKHSHYSDDFWNGLTNNNKAITQFHTVKSGDTFSSIAKKYGTPLKEAILLNPTFDLNKLKDWKRGAKPVMVTKLVSGVETPTGFILARVY